MLIALQKRAKKCSQKTIKHKRKYVRKDETTYNANNDRTSDHKEVVLRELSKLTTKLKKMEEDMKRCKDKLDRFLRKDRNFPVCPELIGADAVYTGLVAMHKDK